MAGQEYKRSGGIVMVSIFVMVVAGLLVVNQWLQEKAGYIVDNPINTSTAPIRPQKIKGPEDVQVARSGDVIRKTRLAPERTYEVHVFYQGGREVARQKTNVGGGTILDYSGTIPDGKVEFIDESNETYGVEYYQGGGRHGPLKELYKDGRPRREAYYQYGKLLTGKEYYQDGIVRMEEDYSDARQYKDRREVGIGKVYSRDGTLKYEWRLTNADPVGFNKSYNQKGELVAEVYYDEYGQVVKPMGGLNAAAAAAGKSPAQGN
jgi:hypothetical protein